MTSKDARTNDLARYIIENPTATDEYGENTSDSVVTAMVDYAICRCTRSYGNKFDYQDFQKSYPALQRGLERDGFTAEDGTLRRALPTVLDLPQADDEVHALLKQYSFGTPLGHLDQGITAHSRGDWASANAQFRIYIEALFDDIAKHYGCPPEHATSGQQRTWLAKRNPPFFIKGLNEWDFQGGGFMESFFRRLHPQGAHPGLSDEDDSTFRLHLVLLVSRQLLRRI